MFLSNFLEIFWHLFSFKSPIITIYINVFDNILKAELRITMQAMLIYSKKNLIKKVHVKEQFKTGNCVHIFLNKHIGNHYCIIIYHNLYLSMHFLLKGFEIK